MKIAPILYLLFDFLYACSTTHAPLSSDEKPALIHQLVKIQEDDQRYRNEATKMRQDHFGVRTAEEAELWQKQRALDSLNMVQVEQIIRKYGFPQASVVSKKLSNACLFVILHASDKQKKYLPMLRREAMKDNVDKPLVATLEDRIRMFDGKKQIYGTAMRYDTIGIKKETGEAITKLRIWPIASYKSLDKRREAMGLVSLKEQCLFEKLDWTKLEGYLPEENKYDADFESVRKKDD
jgi:hypothetical protein